MKNQISSLLERLFPRLSSAGLVLILAYLTGPATVGLYSVTLLIYTFVQASTDTAARQVLPLAIQRGQLTFVKRYSLCAAAGGSTVTLLLCFCVWLATEQKYGSLALTLLPIALAPVFAAVSIKPACQLQVAARWSELATGQLVASILSLCVALPLIIVLANPLGACVQVAGVEFFNAAWCRWRASLIASSSQVPAAGDVDPKRELAVMSIYSALGWSQGQLDRVFITGLAGVARLGAYTFAFAISRTGADALAASTANILRAEISRLDGGVSEIRAVARRVLKQASLLGFCSFLASCLAAVVLSYLMKPVWDSTISIIPLLAVSSIPAALNWSSAPIFYSAGRTRHTLILPLAGLLVAPIIAWAATASLLVAAALVVFREFFVLTVACVLGRDIVSWAAYRRCGLMMAVALVSQVPFTLFLAGS